MPDMVYRRPDSVRKQCARRVTRRPVNVDRAARFFFLATSVRTVGQIELVRFVAFFHPVANLADLHRTLENFSPDDFRRIFVVVHLPDSDLYAAEPADHVAFALP